jgi:hypothetical protein
MVLPEFPHFNEVDLHLMSTIKDQLARFPLEASEYTFTNIFAYRDAYNFKLSLLEDNLIIMKDRAPVSFFCPIGNRDMISVMEEVFNFLDGSGNEPWLERVPESFVTAHLDNSENYVVEEERDHFDYIYDVKALIDLHGRKFHSKKNKVNKFSNSYEYEYVPLSPALIEECLEFEDYWCEVRECEKYYGLNKERCAILEMLKNFDALNLKGGIIRIENKIAALALGEKYLPDTFVIHIEKAHADIPGLYQVINQEFLMHEASGCRFVNREQDLGIEGLRNSKMSYHPLTFVKKYRIKERGKR